MMIPLEIMEFLSVAGRTGGNLHLRLRSAQAAHEVPNGTMRLSLVSEDEEGQEEVVASVVASRRDLLAALGGLAS